MSCNSRDMTIEGALADPVIGAAMRADHVDPKRFEQLLRAKARTLDAVRGSATFSFAPLALRTRREPCGATP